MTILQSKSVSVYGEYDVIVAGGGTAGTVAAIAAAREGLQVLLIEKTGGLGGMQSSGMVSPMMYSGIHGGTPVGSISEEFHRRLIEQGQMYWDGCGYFNPIYMGIVQEQMAVEAGVEILLHTTLVDVVRDEKRVRYAVISNKDGLQVAGAKTFIDCTGDADLCVLAGIPYESGNAQGENQDISLRFEMAGVDIPKYNAFVEKQWKEHGNLQKFLEEKYAEGYITKNDTLHFQTFPVTGKPGCLGFNCPDLGRAVNVIDARYMSRQQISGKLSVLRLANFVKNCVPGFENAFITQISPVLGIRDSRRIHAEYTMTKDDVFQYRKFTDGIAVSNYPLDAHGETAYGAGEGTYAESISPMERYYEVPFRSLIPVGVDNVLCAGRCAGTDFFTQSTTRIQHTCQYMGEAAGIGCRLAIEETLPFREINGGYIRQKMGEYGCTLLQKQYTETN